MSGPNASGNTAPQDSANRYPVPTLDEARAALNTALAALSEQAKDTAPQDEPAALRPEQLASFALFVEFVNLLAAGAIEIVHVEPGFKVSDRVTFGASAPTATDDYREIGGGTFLGEGSSWLIIYDNERGNKHGALVDYTLPLRDEARREVAPAALRLSPAQEHVESFDVVLPDEVDARGVMACVIDTLRQMAT